MKHTTRQDYEARFAHILSGLNTAQREAVEAIEGPVLVVAGPGTGKTHILSARIGQILRRTDTKAHNILCLTYTDAATHAMRERLLEFIGPESHKLHIFTFHSFCNNIIQSNLGQFGLRDVESISKLERIELIQGILEDLPASHPLKPLRGENFYYQKHLENLFDTMKAEGWTVEHIEDRVQAHLESLPENERFLYKRKYKEYNKGDLNLRLVREEEGRMEKLLKAAKLFRVYEQEMQRRRRYDFADMILWVLQAFRENTDLLRRYQEQYLYILVDEFQDTNGAQNQLMSMLIDFWEKPNVFVVGDDDQSIFEFQGARVQNILDFHDRYEKDIELVVLEENYRSSQHILDASKCLIDLNELRLLNQLQKYQVTKNLRAANDVVAQLPEPPQVAEYQNIFYEAVDIASQIKSLIQAGVQANEIAVIYKKHKQADYLTRLLEAEYIPYHTKRNVDILQEHLIQNILDFFKYFQKEYKVPHSGEHQLYKILHVSFFNINIRDIGTLTAYMARLNSERRKRADSPLRWREILRDEKLLNTLKLEDVAALLRFEKMLTRLLADYVNFPLPTVLERFINHSGLLRQMTESEDKAWQTKVVFTLFDFIRLEALKFPEMNLQDLFALINRMKENRIAMGILQVSGTEGGGVNLVTAHSSKGLEFEYVFMIDCGANWEPKSMSRYRFTLPENLTVTTEEQDSMEAARRVFYVAMTRAKKALHISINKTSLEGKKLSPAQFVNELTDAAALSVHTATPDPDALLRAQVLMVTEVEKPVLEQPFSTEELEVMLEGFTLSASGLNTYLSCPLSFYFEYVLKIPSTSSEAAAYGSAMHYAVERLFLRMRGDKDKTFPSAEVMVRDFEREMRRQRLFFTEKSYERSLERGRLLLPDYYAARVNMWHKQVEVEMKIRNVEMEGIPLSGVIDKVEIGKDNSVHVVDYKTGKPKSERTTAPNDKHPNGGDYWRQLHFYKILLECYRNAPYIVTSGEIDYMETDKKEDFKRVSYQLQVADVETVRAQVRHVYASIQQHDFFEGCGKEYCKWCNFTKAHLTVDSMRSEVKEEGDE